MEAPLAFSWLIFVAASLFKAYFWWLAGRARIRSEPRLASGYKKLILSFLAATNSIALVAAIGIHFGGLVDIFSYADFSRYAQNKHFLGFWVLLLGLWTIGTYWVFVRGGAEMLARHPGWYHQPVCDPAKVRRIWIGFLTLNVIALVFGSWIMTMR